MAISKIKVGGTLHEIKDNEARQNIEQINSQLADNAAQLAGKVDKVAGKGLSTNDYTNEDKAEVAKVAAKADKSYVDTQIANVASGSPKGVYATLAALQAAYPNGTTGIYVVTADGKWYYWNGSAWTAGGTYQATGLADDSVKYNHFGMVDLRNVTCFQSINGNIIFDSPNGIGYGLGVNITIKPEWYIRDRDGSVLFYIGTGSGSPAPILDVGSNDNGTYTFSLSHGEYLLFNRSTKHIYTKTDISTFTKYDVLLAFCHSGEIKGGLFYEIRNWLINKANKLESISISSYSEDMTVTKNGTGLIITINSSNGIFITFGDGKAIALGRSGNSTVASMLPTFGDGVAWQDDTQEVIVITMSHNNMLVYDNANNTLKVIADRTKATPTQKLLAFCHNGELKGGALYEYEQRFKIKNIESDISSLDARVTILEGSEAIPSYWESELNASVTSINNIQRLYGKNATSFGFITDFHNNANAGKSPALLQYVMDKCNIKYYFNGGDFATDGSLNTKEQTINDILNAKNKFRNIADRCLRVEGNHDVAYSTLGAPEYYKQNLTPEEMYDVYYRSETLHRHIVWGPTGDCFYADDEAHKVRYIGLNSQDKPYVENPDGSAVDNKMWNFAFRQDQITWFAEKALYVPDDSWSVVVCSHVPPGETSVTGSDYTIANYDLMIGLLNAFKNKTSYSGTGSSEDYPASITADYTNKGGDVICWVAGHVHADKLFTINGINCVTTLNDSLANTSGQPTKTQGTDTEQAFDIFTIDKVNRTVYITRVGAGTDRQFTY